MIATDDKQLRSDEESPSTPPESTSSKVDEQIVSLAYKLVPLPSGCSNCWGDLGEGCTDECRRSSTEHSKKIDEATQSIKQLISEQVRQAEGRGRVEVLNALKQWADKTEVTYNDLIEAELKKVNQLKEQKGTDK